MINPNTFFTATFLSNTFLSQAYASPKADTTPNIEKL